MTPVRVDSYDMNESTELRRRHRNRHRPCFRQDGRTFFQPDVTYLTFNYNCVSDGSQSGKINKYHFIINLSISKGYKYLHI